MTAANSSVNINNRDGKLDFIQALRGIAALMVVMLHTIQQQNIPKDSGVYYWLFSGGGAGVPLFFIISGFIMAYSTRGIESSPKNSLAFLIKRLSRVWPTYAILTIIFWTTVTVVDDFLGAHFPYSILDVLVSILFIPLNMDSALAPLLGGSALYPGWSLNYEIYFYALFAFSMAFRRLKWLIFFSLIATTLIALPLFYGSTPSLDARVNYGFKSYLALLTSPLIWEFAAGVAIGLIYFSKFKIENKSFAIFLCALTAAIAVWANLSKLSFGMGLNGWGWSLTLMFFTLTIASKTVHLKFPAWLIWVGNISYSLYLIHPFFVKPVFDVLWETSLREYIRDPSFSLVVVGLSIFFATLSHKHLEVRLSDFVRNKLLGYVNRGSHEEVKLVRPSAIPISKAGANMVNSG
ncbi:putative acyltransferase transmembrane protein [Pseudomonas chlororaphis subsp. aurantiaca]|uniref:acyltransferase family protein n=1 Tax=Pseudomonas chlororaphis TaxID=587753 RepID=UPI000F567BD9|nr:acyltransferase [Pseudomonas chlororaphis]AZD21413.1 putative acyltransferase transmembrane protein [Pseudomonas chlororaphis subsp. aurantiaca]